MRKKISEREKAALVASALAKLMAEEASLTIEEAIAFSDVDGETLARFESSWNASSESAHAFWLSSLAEAKAFDDLSDFSAISNVAIRDASAAIRRAAIDLLPDEVPLSFVRVLNRLAFDEAVEVRLAAVQALKRFLVDSIACERSQSRVRETVFTLEKLASSRALLGADGPMAWAVMEGLALAENPLADEMIGRMIHGANPDGVAAALTAIRYALDERRAEDVLLYLEEREPVIQLAAIGAAGALRLVHAKPILFRLLLDFERLGPVYLEEVLIALAQIGGDLPRRIIEFFADALDEESELIEVIEDARDILELNEFEAEHFGDSSNRGGADEDESDDWTTAEEYLDQLSVKMDMFLERNGLTDSFDDEDETEEDGYISADDMAQLRSSGHDHYDDEVLSRMRLTEVQKTKEGKRSFLDWTPEEVAAFRKEHENDDFDWDAFLKEEDDDDL